LSGFDPARLLGTLASAGVKFVVIGQTAAFLHGHPEVTVDVDIVPQTDIANVERLLAALGELSARHLAADGPPGGPVDERDVIGLRTVLRLLTDAGPVDVIPFASGLGPYEDLAPRSVAVDIGDGISVLVATLEDVIASKEASGRRKDLRALPSLRAFRDAQG
jgi:hypothetical protein